MQDSADILAPLHAAAVRRRAPVWLAVLLPWALLLSIPGMLLALAYAVWDYRQLRKKVERDWSRWLDASVPAMEDSAALLAGASTPLGKLQRHRLLARAVQELNPGVIGRIVREHVGFDARVVIASAALALGFFGWQQAQKVPPTAQQVQARLAAETSELLLRVTPPKYTGVARFESAPRELQVPEHSVVEWCLKAPQPVDTPVELSDGQKLGIGRECARWTATESVFWRWRGTRYNLRVLADQAPQVTVVNPREMIQVLAPTATSAAIAVTVRDDYQIKRATLHLTLARGSGENIRFSDREMPLPESNDPRARNWNKQWTLAELGMEPGDELYFFVRATDNAERPHTTTSPTYTLRLPGPVAEEEESSALPMLVKPENLRSQRQIIIDTEQLVADMKGGLKQSAVQARSQAIANDQAMLRRRYGQFLGEESSLFGGDDHDEPGEKHDMISQFGHMHDESENATLFDEATKKILRRALSAMWDAEKALRSLKPAPALPPEYKALEAIKELQQADRIYLHKTAFVPPPLKEEIRMTGDVVGAKSYKRAQGEPEETIPPGVRTLIQTLAGDAPLPALWTRDAQDWIRSRINDDEQRLAAQRAVQDVADGCVKCRPVLRAWLRGAIGPAPVLLQATPVAESKLTRALRGGGAP